MLGGRWRGCGNCDLVGFSVQTPLSGRKLHIPTLGASSFEVPELRISCCFAAEGSFVRGGFLTWRGRQRHAIEKLRMLSISGVIVFPAGLGLYAGGCGAGSETLQLRNRCGFGVFGFAFASDPSFVRRCEASPTTLLPFRLPQFSHRPL